MGKIYPMKIFFKNAKRAVKQLEKVEKRFIKMNRKYGLDKHSVVGLLPDKAKGEYRELLKEARQAHKALMEAGTDMQVVAETFVITPLVGTVALIEKDAEIAAEWDKNYKVDMAMINSKRLEAERAHKEVMSSIQQEIKKAA
jgi:hypothetical protein